MVELHEQDGGVMLPLIAQPSARRDAIVGEHNHMLKVSVTQPPEAGKANAAIAKLLAVNIGIGTAQIVQLAGKTSRRKRSLILDVSLDELRKRINRLIGD